MRSLVLDAPDWPGHRAGQHVDVRLTAEDGYQAAAQLLDRLGARRTARSCITVERLDDGEVSPYLVDELRAGRPARAARADRRLLRVGRRRRRPAAAGRRRLGDRAADGDAARARRPGSDAAVRLLASWRTAADIIYADELERLGALDGIEIVHTLTRETPAGWTGRLGRVDQAMLAELAWPAEAPRDRFVCGPTGLVEAVAAGLVALGHAPERIKTERFGPTGG